MRTEFKTVSDFVDRHAMLARARVVLVAVSGGPDSVALLDMLCRIGNRSGSEFEIHVAHFDHMLRGGESAEDARFVAELARGLGLAFTTGSGDVRERAGTTRRGIEETARAMRYEFLATTAGRVGAQRVATGHTMTDQAETFLMRLLRGSGLRGLAAMRPVGSMPVASGALPAPEDARQQGGSTRSSPNSQPLLIRPLLCLTRERIESYIEKRGLLYRTDSSNVASHYTRNRVRRELLPALRRANPKAIAVLSRTAELIAADQDALDELAVGFLNQARIESKWGIAGENEAARRERIEAPAYSVSAFLARPLALRRRMIIEALRRFKAGTMLGDGETGLAEIGFSHIAAVEGLLGDGCSGKRIQLPGRIEVWREFDELVFKRTGAAQGPGESRIDEIDSAASAGGLRIELERSVSGGLLETLIEETRLEARRRGRDWLTAVLDDDRLPKTLIVRTRRAGETAWVLGQRQTKKLKNLMIEHRIPTSRRATWPVVATPEGQYVWSPGLPPANDFAANDETHGLAILRALGI